MTNHRLTPDFTGRSALITGAASGIGAATAAAIAAGGGRVVLTDINEAAGRAKAHELNGHFLKVDVTSEAEVAAAVAATVELHGRLDVMVNNAGVIGAVGPIGDTSDSDWKRTIAILLDGVFYGTKHAARVMRQQRSGAIVSLTSIAGLMGGVGPHAYTAAKHGVVGLTKSVASELAPFGVRVNAVAPGATLTPLIVKLRGDPDAARQLAAESSPLGTITTAEDIAAAIAFLASDQARQITGQILAVDAGVSGAGKAVPSHHLAAPGFLASAS